jgi:hypothetical protein
LDTDPSLAFLSTCKLLRPSDILADCPLVAFDLEEFSFFFPSPPPEYSLLSIRKKFATALGEGRQGPHASRRRRSATTAAWKSGKVICLIINFPRYFDAGGSDEAGLETVKQLLPC